MQTEKNDRREAVAIRLLWESIHQGQRALSGAFAAPASLALGVAAGVTYAAAVLERTVEIFQTSLDTAARGLANGQAPDWLLRTPESGAEKQARS
jgi:hypothetical protein